MAEQPLVRYQHSGRIGASLLVAGPLCGALAASSGAGYQWLVERNRLVVFNPLLPLLLGLVLGLLSAGALAFGKVRHKPTAWLLVVATAGVGYGMAWLYVLGVWREEFAGFGPAVRGLLAGGGEMPARGDGRIVPGLRLLCWLYEATLVLAVAIAWPLSWFRRAVFCEDRARFVRREKLGVGYGPSPLAVRQAAQDHGLEGLLDLGIRPVPANATEGELRFFLHRAAGANYMTVFWHGQLDSPRGRPMRRDVLVLRRVRAADTFLDRLRQKTSAARPARKEMSA